MIGSGSDADGKVVAYLWSEVSGPSTATIANPGFATTEVSGFLEGSYLFQLMVTDDKGATGVDTVSVTVSPSPMVNLVLVPANNQNEFQVAVYDGADALFKLLCRQCKAS